MSLYTNDFRNAQSIDDLKIMLNKYFEWFFSSLDHLNVKQLYTEYCNIQSENGETVINGPVFDMYDKQATPVRRLRQGYDSVTGDFVFEMFNKTGYKTVGIDSNGNGTLNKITLRNDLTGSAYIQIDSTGFKANDGLKNTVEIDTLGKAYFRGDITSEATITGATIRSGAVGTNRIELSGGKLQGITSTGLKTGLYFDINTIPTTYITDVCLYHNDSQLLVFYDEIDSTRIKPGTGASLMSLGTSGKSMYFDGTLNFGNPSVAVNGLNTDLAGSHNHGIPDGTMLAITNGTSITGSVAWTSSGAHTHNVKRV